MGHLVLHAGMIKAGSSSIQAWLAANRKLLRATGVSVLAARPDGAGGLRLVEAPSTFVASNPIRKAYEDASDQEALLDHLFELLDWAAARHRLAVVSSEALHGFFSRAVEPFLTRLEHLARRHLVRIAYYVRPQHTALEASWRQWGFRRPGRPSEYMASHGEAFLHHFETYTTVTERCPSAVFEPRPFRPDLLELGDPACDFARRFLGVTPPPESRSTWANRGLALEVVNALRPAPPGRFWTSEHDNSRFDRIRELLANLPAEESESVGRSRLLLQSWCRERFEQGNRQLIAALGWPTESFVPPPPAGVDASGHGLEELDRLWEPRLSPIEREALYRALDEALARSEEEKAELRGRALGVALHRLRRRVAARRPAGRHASERLVRPPS